MALALQNTQPVAPNVVLDVGQRTSTAPSQLVRQYFEEDRDKRGWALDSATIHVINASLRNGYVDEGILNKAREVYDQYVYFLLENVGPGNRLIPNEDGDLPIGRIGFKKPNMKVLTPAKSGKFSEADIPYGMQGMYYSLKAPEVSAFLNFTILSDLSNDTGEACALAKIACFGLEGLMRGGVRKGERVWTTSINKLYELGFDVYWTPTRKNLLHLSIVGIENNFDKALKYFRDILTKKHLQKNGSISAEEVGSIAEQAYELAKNLIINNLFQ